MADAYITDATTAGGSGVGGRRVQPHPAPDRLANGGGGRVAVVAGGTEEDEGGAGGIPRG